MMVGERKRRVNKERKRSESKERKRSMHMEMRQCGGRGTLF